MNKQIVIIGAGASGIAAATKLLGAGFHNILILEAECRIGGRVNTIPFGANVVDLGAQWCHGEKDNVVFDLAKDKDLLAPKTASFNNQHWCQSTGRQVPNGIAPRLWNLLHNLLEEVTSLEKVPETSLGNYIHPRYNEELKKRPEFENIDPQLAKQFIETFERQETALESADTWFETSLRGLQEYWECEGDQSLHWKDKGYGFVLELLQRKFPTNEEPIPIDEKVLFNKEVSNVTYNQQGMKYSATIECTDGSKYEADHVICTVSLGVLKERHLNLFTPILPIEKIIAIEGINFGTVNKIYLEFDKPFWPDGWYGPTFLWNFEQLKIVREHKNSWLEGIYGFLTVDMQPNILCGWIVGPNSRRMEQTPIEEIQSGCMWLLRMFLSEFNIPDPVRIITSKWNSNPHFRGSYSFYSLKSDALSATTTELSKPIVDSNGHPVLQFAGEATNEHHFSTVHGAVESGWREAKRLIDLYA